VIPRVLLQIMSRIENQKQNKQINFQTNDLCRNSVQGFGAGNIEERRARPDSENKLTVDGGFTDELGRVFNRWSY
jgi:hypothetical protein